MPRQNKEKIREYDRLYRARPENKIKQRLATAKYRASEKGKAAYAANLDNKKAVYKKWVAETGYKKSPELKAKEKLRKTAWYAIPENRIKELIKSARLRCVKSGLAFDELYMNTLKDTLHTNCKCCNIEFDYNARRTNVPSLDRIDNTKGYIKDNVYVLCHICNINKSNMTYENLILLANYIGKYTNTIPHLSLNRKKTYMELSLNP